MATQISMAIVSHPMAAYMVPRRGGCGAGGRALCAFGLRHLRHHGGGGGGLGAGLDRGCPAVATIEQPEWMLCRSSDWLTDW